VLAFRFRAIWLGDLQQSDLLWQDGCVLKNKSLLQGGHES
jgi:hypothetical protein